MLLTLLYTMVVYRMLRGNFRTLRAIALGAFILGAKQFAQADDFGCLNEAIRNAVNAANTEQKARNQSGYSAPSNGSCVVGAMIDRGGDSSLVWNFSLLSGKSYIFIAAGDSDVTGLELTCMNRSEGKPFDSRKGVAPVSHVEIPADKDRAVVRVDVKVTASKDVSDFVVILCLESSGTPGNLDELEGCVAHLAIKIAGNSDSANLALDENHDDICLYSGLYTSDTPDRIFHRMFRKGTHYELFSAGDVNCKNIAMNVLKRSDAGGDGEQVARDSGADPVIQFDAGTDEDWREQYPLQPR